MTRRLVIAMALLAAFVAVALAIPLVLVVANDQREALVSRLEVDTLATAAQMAAQPSIDWQATAEATAESTGARVVVVDLERTLAADSGNTELDRAFDRLEIDAALAGSLASDVRMSQTLGEELRYVAAPIVQGYNVVGAVRLSLPESIVDDAVEQTQRWLAVFVVTVIATAGLVAWVLARSIVGPLDRVARVAADLPNDLDQRAPVDEGPAEVRAVAVALNGTAERLSEILRRTQRVAADASHHLRTPLTGVRLRLEAIEDVTDQPEVADEARAATVEVDRLTHRIEQVLELAKGDAGSLPLEEQDLGAIVRQRADAATPVFSEAGIAIDVDAVDEALVRAPRGSMARIVDELLGNALQYAREHVIVGVDASPQAVVLTVADDGPGVPEGEREAVFERFRRGSAAAPGGTGLGLALVRETVASVRGEVQALVSREGGLLVRVELPRVARDT